MTVQEMIGLIDAKDMTPETDKKTEVTCGYTCDLLSWVMAQQMVNLAQTTRE